MKRLAKLLMAATIICTSQTVSATDFFSTENADELFRIGARAGMNMANVSAGGDNFSWNHDSWGTGFDAGVIVDINFRDWLTIQPGLFYQSRSNNYTHIVGYGTDRNVTVGHTLHYALVIPVVASVRFNPANNIRWSIDMGPYISLGLGHQDKGQVIVPQPETSFNKDYFDDRHNSQWGIKMGTGLNILDHYYIGIHYMAGIGNVYKKPGVSGHAKAWTFTLGYDF